MDKVYNIAILGAGSTGITAAVEAKLAGIQDTILFEKDKQTCMTLRTYYKDGKRVDKDYKGIVVDLKGNIPFTDGNKESTIELFEKLLKEHNIKLEFNSNVENIVKEGDIFSLFVGKEIYKAKFVIIAIGNMGKPNKPSYKIPSSIRANVNYNVQKCSKDEKILVVGGGNSATEYAYDLRELNEITLNYRKTEFTRINDINLKNIMDASNDGSLKLKTGIDIEGLEDNDGKIKVNFTDGHSEDYDRVIYAIGGVLPIDFLSNCGIECDKKGANFNDNYETNIKGVYVAGDLAKGGSISAGMDHSYNIIKDIKNKL